jgi:hypothetical protein
VCLPRNGLSVLARCSQRQQDRKRIEYQDEQHRDQPHNGFWSFEPGEVEERAGFGGDAGAPRR